MLMSRRTKKDYKKILRSLKRMLPGTPSVEVVVADFECAVWKAVPRVYPLVQMRGCCYHWSQAVWRKTQEIGLQSQYNEKDAVYKIIRKMLVLPFLPEEHISPTFQHLETKCCNNEKLNKLASYIRSTWIESSTFAVGSWSVFMQPVRTNNDVEGWHRRLNGRAVNSNVPFYVLIPLLREEAKTLTLQQKLLSNCKLSRCQRKKYRTLQARLFNAWDSYNCGNKTTGSLLREIARLYGPV